MGHHLVPVPGIDPGLVGRRRSGGADPPRRRRDGGLHRRGPDLGHRTAGPSRACTTGTASSCSTPQAEGGEPVEFFVEAAANPIPPWHLADWPLLLPDYAGAPCMPSGRPSWRSSTGRSRGSGSTCGPGRAGGVDPDRAGEISRRCTWPRRSSTPRSLRRGGRPGPARTAPATGAPPRSNTRHRRGPRPHRLAPGCGRCARPDANAPGPSPTSCACSSATPSTTSSAARRCSTSG